MCYNFSGDKMKIGNVKIANKFFLAPMAGICDNAFRTIVKRFGAGLIYTEMVSEKAIYYQNEKTLKMLYVSDEEKPVSLQVFGSDLKTFEYAVEYIDKNSNCDIIDINMGCPVPKVATRANSGAGLMKDPELVYNIVKRLVEISKKPITVKIRTGWDNTNVNAVKIAKLVEKAGASAIAIHGRTRKQMYSGDVDLDTIKAVKEAVEIPVIGNGDIVDINSAIKMFEYTKVDAIMIGRGSLGNPWIFKQLNQYFNNEEVEYPTFEEKLEVAREHFLKLVELKGERVAVREMRTHFHYYVKGMPGCSEYKQLVNKLNSKEEYMNLIDDYLNYLQKKKAE